MKMTASQCVYEDYVMTNYLHDQARGVFRTPTATFIPTALYGNGPAALTTVTPTSDDSQKDTRGILKEQ
jgi:hypothetical protein